MGLFSKKEKVPEIPPAPRLPSLPSMPSPEKNDLPELPSFPQNSRNENLNQEMVKHAVADEDNTPEDNEVVVDMPSPDLVQDGSHNISQIPEPPKPKPIPQIPPAPIHEPRRTLELSPLMPAEPPKTKTNEPIFVRIDKFQEAQKDFKQIKLKVKEIESALKKVQSLKEKEDEEIAAWSEDLEKLKSRLSEVDSNIFNKL